MNYCLISTYNRQKEVADLVKSIPKDIATIVFDDGSEPAPEVDCALIKYPHHGKIKYHKLVTEMFQYLKGKEFKYFWMIPDDVILNDGFFEKSIGLWERIKDDRKICLSVGHTHGRHYDPCWTYFNPVKMGDVVLTNWNDLCFMAEKKFLEELDFRIERPFDNYDYRSSGVGRHISRRLYSFNWNMYHTDKSLCEFPANQTKMHAK